MAGLDPAGPPRQSTLNPLIPSGIHPNPGKQSQRRPQNPHRCIIINNSRNPDPDRQHPKPPLSKRKRRNPQRKCHPAKNLLILQPQHRRPWAAKRRMLRSRARPHRPERLNELKPEQPGTHAEQRNHGQPIPIRIAHPGFFSQAPTPCTIAINVVALRQKRLYCCTAPTVHLQRIGS